jgi:hypothetical protein
MGYGSHGEGVSPNGHALSVSDLERASDFMRSWQHDDTTDYQLLNGMSDAGLRRLTAIVADHCAVPAKLDGLNRGGLMQELKTLLDDTHQLQSMTQTLGRDVVTINSSQPWVERIDNSAVHARSERQDQLMLGTRRNVTEMYLHKLRRAAGWKSATTMAGELQTPPRPTLDTMIGNIETKKRNDLMARNGVSTEAATEQVQREYVARHTYHHHLERTPLEYIQLSPEAAHDLRREYQRQAEGRGLDTDAPPVRIGDLKKKGMIPLESIRGKWRLQSNQLIPIVDELYQQKLEQLSRLSFPQASENAAEYIAIAPPRTLGRRTYRYLSPEARDDLETILEQRFPNSRGAANRQGGAVR